MIQTNTNMWSYFIIYKLLLVLFSMAFIVACGCGRKNQQPSSPSPVETANINIAPEPTLDDLKTAIEKCIQSGNYPKAVDILSQIDAPRLAQRSLSNGDVRWLAIYEDALVFPGINNALAIDLATKPSRYCIIPGTSDVILNKKWQSTATQFAANYNKALQVAHNGKAR